MSFVLTTKKYFFLIDRTLKLIITFIILYNTNGFSYNRFQAVRYADKWVDHLEESSLRNNSGKEIQDNQWPFIDLSPNDCANYVSQCLIAGGINLLKSNYDETGRHVVAYCDYLHEELQNHMTEQPTRMVYNGTEEAPANMEWGDVIIFGTVGDDEFKHAAIVRSGSGNDIKFNAHTSDRWNRHWTFAASTDPTKWNCIHFYHIDDNAGAEANLRHTETTQEWFWPISISTVSGNHVDEYFFIPEQLVFLDYRLINKNNAGVNDIYKKIDIPDEFEVTINLYKNDGTFEKSLYSNNIGFLWADSLYTIEDFPFLLPSDEGNYYCEATIDDPNYWEEEAEYDNISYRYDLSIYHNIVYNLTAGVKSQGNLSGTGNSQVWNLLQNETAIFMKTTLDEFDPSNDFEIYGRCGSDPTTSNYDWKWDSKDNGKVEATHQFPETGTWHIMAYSAAGSGSYRILCDLDYDDQEPTIESLSAIYENDGTSVGSKNLQNKTVPYDLVLHTYDEENGERFQVSKIEYFCYLEGETEPDPIVVFDTSQPDIDNVYLGDHKYALTNHSAVGGHLDISGYDDNTHLVIKAVVYDHFIESRSKSITETFIIGTIPDNVIPRVHNVYLTEETNETDAPYDDKYNNKILERTKYDIIVEVSDIDAYENPQEVKKIEYQYYPYLNESTQEFEWSPWFAGFEKNISNSDIIYAHGDNPDPNNNNHYKYVLTNHDVNADENGYLDFTDATKFPEEKSFKIKIRVDDNIGNPSGEIYKSNWDYSIVYQPLDINDCVIGEELAYYFTLEDDEEEDPIKEYTAYNRKQLLPYGTDMDLIVRAHSKRRKYDNEIEKFDIQKIKFVFRHRDNYNNCIIRELTTTARNHYFTTQESMREFMYADTTDPANGIFEYIVTNGNNLSSDNGTLNFPQSWQTGETVGPNEFHRKYVYVYDWYGNVVRLEDGLNCYGFFLVVKPDDYDWGVHENVPESSILINNYPNPFNNNTKIDYKIFLKANIEISIYNIMGQKIKILEKCQKLEGSYSLTWNGQDDNNRDVPSGVYFCVIRAQNLNKSTKLIVLR